MVEYVIALTVATLVVVAAMTRLGEDMAYYFLWAQAIILYPI